MLKTVTVSIPARTFVAVITVAVIVATQLVRRLKAQQYADGYVTALQHQHQPS